MIWRNHLVALGATVLAILAIFHNDLFDMADKWWNISTYSHCLVIPMIIGWLIHERRSEVAALRPAAWWPGLVGIAVGAFGWMLGEAAGISLFRHVALIVMLQASVVTILGPSVARGLTFPLFYAVFLIPFGEEAIPAMQTITAKMSMVLLAMVGIPAQIEGVFITISTGLFEVAEACSGIKFLVAMIAFSTLSAHLCFVSWRRRAAFMVMAMVVPVFANGIRAFATIYISYLTNSTEFASSFDHIIFGWVFFALVMLIVMGIAWPFFDRVSTDPFLDGSEALVKSKPAPLVLASLASLAVVVAMIMLQGFLANLGRTPLPQLVMLPQVAGWERTVEQVSYPWQPRFDGADHRLGGQYIDADGNRVDVLVVLYGWQAEGKEIVGFGQGLLPPESGWSWANATPAPENGKADMIYAPGAEREVASFYMMGGKMTGSASRIKLATLKARMLGGDQVAAAILISAENTQAKPARVQIDAFLRALGPVDQLAASLIQTARGTS